MSVPYQMNVQTICSTEAVFPYQVSLVHAWHVHDMDEVLKSL
jgi:hypothetical protein